MSGMPLLEVEDLHVTFRTASGPVHAVDGVSFTMKPGSSLGVVGESGSGKSVTARALLRLFAITDDVQISGAVHFDGQDLLRIDERRLRDVRGGQIGMIFQDPLTSLNPLMAVGEQIAESLRLHRGMSRSEAAAEAVELLARVGIADPEQRATELPSSFSGGMRQRVMISLAIACRPRLLIADEPTTALDVTVQAEILLLLDELRRSEGMALMLITHDFGVVAATCDDVQVMYAGKLVEKASMAHLFDRANHPYTEGLLRLVPRFEDAHTGRLHPIPGQPPITGGGGSSCAFAPRCSYAVDRCRSEVPPEVAVGPQHLSACWLATDRAKDNTEAGQPWRRAQ
ncbi:MAG: ABC transporter ATP-binding protein [Acidimicrobiaceae bacterium]|nr:ABC transporter ATP-binding protein [Acidimicrobiaceae bacterium]